MPTLGEDERKKLRTPGGYKCAKCGLPKKGHVCALE